MVDSLSKKNSTFTSMKVKVVGFEVLKDLYRGDADFSEICKASLDKPFKDYMVVHEFFFKGNSLCIPSSSLLLSILDELHCGPLGAHFGRNKTLALVRANFYLTKMERDATRFMDKCIMCLMAKTRS